LFGPAVIEPGSLFWNLSRVLNAPTDKGHPSHDSHK